MSRMKKAPRPIKELICLARLIEALPCVPETVALIVSHAELVELSVQLGEQCASIGGVPVHLPAPKLDVFDRNRCMFRRCREPGCEQHASEGMQGHGRRCPEHSRAYLDQLYGEKKA